jgi:hypothetical protein
MIRHDRRDVIGIARLAENDDGVGNVTKTSGRERDTRLS